MKFLLNILLIAALSFLAGMFLPWWSIALVALVVAILLPQRTGLDFLSGFIGIFLMWAVVSTWIDIANEHILSHKLAQVLPLGGSSLLLVVVTAFVGGLVGGFAAMAGSSLRPYKIRRRLHP
ncbi:MAG TPA: hypothetical protein VNR87_01120 [Flavisolibacter sp.]|nr:hypothetical protein [Flavisolibacter sp.]